MHTHTHTHTHTWSYPALQRPRLWSWCSCTERAKRLSNQLTVSIWSAWQDIGLALEKLGRNQASIFRAFIRSRARARALVCVRVYACGNDKNRWPCTHFVTYLNSLDVKADGRNSRHYLAQLELVQDGGLASCVQTHHQDAALFLGEKSPEHLMLRVQSLDAWVGVWMCVWCWW